VRLDSLRVYSYLVSATAPVSILREDLTLIVTALMIAIPTGITAYMSMLNRCELVQNMKKEGRNVRSTSLLFESPLETTQRMEGESAAKSDSHSRNLLLRGALPHRILQ